MEDGRTKNTSGKKQVIWIPPEAVSRKFSECQVDEQGVEGIDGSQTESGSELSTPSTLSTPFRQTSEPENFIDSVLCQNMELDKLYPSVWLYWSTRIYSIHGVWLCQEAELNRRHEDFQSTALPTELSRQPFFSA